MFMKKIALFMLITLYTFIDANSQVYFEIEQPAQYPVERLARFSVSDAANDFLEIVNSTQYNNQFAPNLWAHRVSDNRLAFRLFASINSNVDNGNNPITVFRTELRNTINDSYPFPWGTHYAEVQNRPLFAWENSNSTKMLMKANGYLGLGTTNPTAQFHSTGTLRFQNLPNATTPTYLLGTDASGNVKEYPISVSGGSDVDWLKTNGDTPTSINDHIYTYGRVGIGTINPSYSLQVHGDIYANGGWLRTSGNRGLYFQSYGGGFYMEDATWIRTYNNKSFYHNAGIMRTDGTFQVGSSGNRFTVNASGNVGIATTAPTAKLHSNGTVRFQNLPNGENPTYILGTDASGNVREYSNTGEGVSLNKCSLPKGVDPMNHLTKITKSGDLTCSQVYDNGENVGIGTYEAEHKLSVNGNIQSMSNIFISDKRFKKDISKIENPLETILKLNGKKYNWRVGEFRKYDFTDKKQIGFIAQEVRKVIPEIVHVNKEGEHSMNYTAIIPLLVEAMKEQQNQITLLQNKWSDVKMRASSDEDLILTKKTVFSTNYPNPFSTSTTVDYYILKRVNTAKIIIYDTNGSTITTYQLKERGIKSQLIINKDKLKSGIYFYTMITDDVVIGTKKMIVQ